MNIQYRENGSFVSNVDESTAKEIIKVAKEKGYRVIKGKGIFDIKKEPVDKQSNKNRKP
jgi:predicted ThiF/HesA family dinucleotide-utilizing enzyme